MNTSNKKATHTGKLSKRFLMSLPDGGYIVSNVVGKNSRPVLAEPLDPRNGREPQWKRIREKRVDQQTVHHFSHQAAYDRYLDDIQKLFHTENKRPPQA